MIRIVYIVVSTLLLALASHSQAQTFTRWVPVCSGIPQAGGIALGDLDGDSDLDVVFANGQHLPEPDWAMANNGNGVFSSRRSLGDGRADPSYGVALGDLDGDGDLDAVIANDFGVSSVAYQNDGRGNFTFLAWIGPNSHARRALALGDFDRDGDLDVVLVGFGQDHVYFNENRGRRWTERRLGSRPVGRATAVAVSDVDADDDIDIVIPGRYEAETLVYLNDGRGDFAETRQIGGAEDTTAVAIGDLDGDEDPDIVAGNLGQRHVVYANDGRGHFVPMATFGDGQDGTWTIALADMDLDGDLDIVTGNVNVSSWSDDPDGDNVAERSGFEMRGSPSRIYVNAGQGRFDRGASLTTGSENTRPIALGDVDRDGDVDVIVGNSCQANYVFLNSINGPKIPVSDPVLSLARRQWSRAANSADKVIYGASLANDVVWIDFTGKVADKASLLEQSPLRVTGGEGDLRLYSSGAVIVGYRGGGVLRHIQAWIRRGDQWQMVSTHETRVGDEPVMFWPPLAVGSPLPVSSGDVKEQQAIQELLRSFETAIQTHDAKNLLLTTTSEFVAQLATGQVQNRDEWMMSPTTGYADATVEANATRLHDDFAVSNRLLRAPTGERYIQTIVITRERSNWAVAALATTAIASSGN